MISVLVKKVLVVSNANFLAQLIPFLFLPILSRLYDPSRFGEYGVYLAVAMISSQFFGLKLDAAIIKASSQKKVESIINLSLILSFCLLVSATIILITINQILAKFNFSFSIHIYLYSLISGFYLTSFNLFSSYLIRLEKYFTVSILNVSKSILMVSISVLLAEYTKDGMMFAHIVTFFLIFLFFLYLTKNFIFKFSYFRLKYSFILNINFIRYYSIHGLINVFNVNMPVLLLTPFYSSNLIGHLTMANRLIMTPLGIISTSLNKVLYQTVSRFYENFLNNGLILNQLKSILLSLFVFFSLFHLFFWIYGELFVTLLLGDKWIDAYYVSFVLFPWCAIRAMAGVFSFAPLVFSEQKNALNFELFYVSLIFIVIILSVHNDLEFLDVISFISFFGFIAVFLQLVWYFYLFGSFGRKK